MHFQKICLLITLATGMVAASISYALAACSVPNRVLINARFPNYPFWHAVADEMQQCGNLKVKFNFDAATVEHDPASPDQDLGMLTGVSNASLQRLLDQNLLRPLDDLVKMYGERIHPRQIIKIDGRVMAVAVAANARVLMVHRELLSRENILTPRTYQGLAKAAERLKGSPLYNSPLTMAYRPGWHLTQEFLDLYITSGGELFAEDKKPVVNNKLGSEVLEQLKALRQYLPKEHLERDSSGVLNDLMRFNSPMGITWVTSAGPLDNPSASRVHGKMQIAPVPSAKYGGMPAATLWWDGFAIPKSATDEQAKAAFILALEGLDEDLLKEHQGDALWLMPEYKPGRLTAELLAAIDKGMPLYPDSRELSLLRRALNTNIEDFFKGKVSAANALALAEADFMRAAREIGLSGF